MSEHPAESGGGQWAVRAENGLTCHSSEDVARAAITQGGYTLGPDRSPIVEALFRATPDAEWTSVTPPGEGRA